MTIIPSVPVLGHGAMHGAPFCDFLNVSYDSGESLNVRDALRPLIDYCGYSEQYQGVYRRPGESGALRLGRRHKVFVVSLSGDVCRCIREMGVWHDFLLALGSFPHRVTMLHASADFLVPSPSAVIRKAKELGYEGLVRFTRKWVTPEHVRSQMGLSVVDGSETGTVYFNKRDRADVWARIYDKQNERLEKGFADPGSIVRLEIGLMSDVGATLRDASDPLAIFLAYASQTLCQVTGDFPQWVSQAQGYVLARPTFVPSPHERLQALLDTSLDVGRLCNIAREAFGADALSVLTGLLARRLSQKPFVASVAA